MQAFSYVSGQETPPHSATLWQATGTFSVTRWQAHWPSTQAGPNPSGQSEEHSETAEHVVTTPAGAQAQAPSTQAWISFAPHAAAAEQSAGVVQEMVLISEDRHLQRRSFGSQKGAAPSGQVASLHSASSKQVPP
jgi:hypothetical protein